MAIIDLEFFSSQVMKTVHTKVFLPHGEADLNVESPFRTVYFLPGFSNAASDLLTLSDVRLLAQQHGIAVVMLDGDNSFYVDQGPFVNYSSLASEELVTVTRKLFPLSSRREDTYIGGMSMGGFGAFYNGIKHTETFSKIALLAPGFDFYDVKTPGTDNPGFPEGFLNRIFGSREQYLTSEKNFRVLLNNALENGVNLPEIFFAYGDADLIVGEADKQFSAYMEQKSIPVRHCPVTGGHDMIFLRNALPHFFAFLGERQA